MKISTTLLLASFEAVRCSLFKDVRGERCLRKLRFMDVAQDDLAQVG